MTDEKFMQRAITLARRGEGRTSPNPLVGSVIAREGKVIAEGWHKVCGGDHAEVDALKKAGARAKGATMYVTLEPCAHWGRTPPCVDAVLAAGIKRIVIAMQDPNPLTRGKSIRKLRARGVDVVVGVGQADAKASNLAFIKYIRCAMPYVVAKVAQTMDGKAGTRSGRVRWITSEATRARARQRRCSFDAIVVGVNTILADDPGLDAPGRTITKVIVDSRLRTPPDAACFKGMGRGQVILATTRKASPDKVAAFQEKGVRVMVCPSRNAKVDLKALFKGLAKNGFIRILVEGGPTLVAAALKAGVVDRMHIYIAPRILKANDAVAGVDVARYLDTSQLKVAAVERTGKDIFIEADYVHRDR